MSRVSTQPDHGSDAAVFADARKRLDDCRTIPGTVRVHVDSRFVTLTGSVQFPSERFEAEEVIKPALAGRRLINYIVVNPIRSPEGFEAPNVKD
jgi:hypothetical protein